jgi:hypothetical protein
MLRRISRRAALLVIVVAGIFATAAGAAQAMTVSIGQPTLSPNRVQMTVPVTVSCSSFDPSLTLFDTAIEVSVEQAAGTAVASGLGVAQGYLPYSPLLWACDEGSQTVLVSVPAYVGGAPFHGGPAVFSATAVARAGWSCGDGCWWNVSEQDASTGPTRIVVH